MASSGRFDGGISFYTKGMVEFYFPENAVVCYYCQLLRNDYGKRMYCGKTMEVIPEPETMIGGMCPMLFDENNLYVPNKKEEK